MTLQRKFAVLLAVLALAVLANLATALWTISFLESMGGRWGEIQQVQNGLNSLKRAATDQAHLWAPQFPLGRGEAERPDPHRAREVFESDAASIARTMEALERLGIFRLRVGASTAANLRTRVEQSQASGREYLRSPSEATAAAASVVYFDLHELIERIENAVISHAYFEADFGRSIRPILLLLLMTSLAGALLAGVLGVVLVRRWVVRPLGVLRDAAERLGKGDFSHRVPVGGKDELGLLSAEINHMAGLISSMQDERVDRERLAAVGEMVRRLAHNLRNPLAGIRSLAELTRADLPADSPALENQNRIVSTVDRFERWLSELLSATTPLTISPQVGDVAPWLNAVVEPLRPLADEKSVALDVRTDAAPARATFDARHLEQAVVAVLTNAIQASPRGQRVVLWAQASENGESWEIRCSDLGPGVNPKIKDQIFRPYVTTKRDGTGIGLAVAKQVVEQHGGRIWVENGSGRAVEGLGGKDKGSGAVFVMRLPLAVQAKNQEHLASIGQIGVDGGKDSDRRR